VGGHGVVGVLCHDTHVRVGMFYHDTHMVSESSSAVTDSRHVLLYHDTHTLSVCVVV